ncbi:MAG: hypothetical protein FWB78_07575 [Treponema sp.]|nr:hypothetical protein [Treponema sp.]
MKKLVCLRSFGFVLLASAIIFASCDMGTETVEIRDVATPVITTQPAGGPIGIGQHHTMTVEATGEGLSFQWFQFVTPYEFENSLSQLIEGAVEASFTTPSLYVEGAHNFYVIVTNTNNQATGRREISVRSYPAMITVNDPNNAMFPIITAHPENVGNVIFRRHMEIPVLSVAAETEDGGEISFQWFVADELTNLVGREISGATGSSFSPSVFLDEPGSFYFFVRVTNTNIAVSGRRQSFSLSNPAFVDVVPNPSAEEPIITTQPVGAILFLGDEVAPISVVADTDDGGVLSFQWQTSPTATGTFSDIAGAVGAEFIPAINTAAVGRHFFRVAVVNHAEHATEEPYARLYSRVAEVNVTSPSAITPNLIINIADLTIPITGTTPTSRADSRAASNRNQFVRGFGGMDVAWDNFPTLRPQDFDTLFGDGPDQLALNMLRIMILPWNADPMLMLEEFTACCDGEFFFYGVRHVNARGGYVLASPWSPPAVWKSNNSIVGTGRAYLRPMFYQAYANYLREFAQIMANNGAPLFAIQIQNEPNFEAHYDGCWWTPAQMRDFFREVGWFTRAGRSGVTGPDSPFPALGRPSPNWPTSIPGFGGGRPLPYVKAMSGSSANNPNIHNELLNCAYARDMVFSVGRHPYGNRNNNLAGQLGQVGNNATYHDEPREVWQTEFNLNHATNWSLDSLWPSVWSLLNSIDITIRNNHENTYIWWAIKRFYSMIGEGEAGTVRGAILPRGWAMSHYARFASGTYHVNVEARGHLINPANNELVPVSFQGVGNTAGNLNPRNFTNLGGLGNHVGGGDTTAAESARVTAFVRLRDNFARPLPDPFPVNLTDWDGNVNDIDYISFVMFTPTNITAAGATGDRGWSMGDVRLELPPGFRIRGAETMRSVAPDPVASPRTVTPYFGSEVEISYCRGAAYVYLPRDQILSIRLFNE